MSLIPYPDVPQYEGVPDIPRQSEGSPAISITIAPQNWNINQSNSDLPWGIFTLSDEPFFTPSEGGILSVVNFGFSRSTGISDFPVAAPSTGQGSSFASFNKVFRPYSPVLVLALKGTEGEKIAFLKAIDDACSSTTLYNVYTPDSSYSGADGACTLEGYSYQRSATHGATLLTVEVSLKQIKQVQPSLSNVALSSTSAPANGASPNTAPINNPQSPSATPGVNNGNTQPKTPSAGIVKSVKRFFNNLLGKPA